MASDLIATTQVEALVQSGLTTADLEVFIDAMDADIVRFAGPHDGSQKVVLRVDRSENVYLPRPAESVSEIKEWIDAGTEADATALASTEYALQSGGRYIRRKTGYWRRNVAVTFTPYAENARRTGVLIDLVKWELSRKGSLTRERVGQYEVYLGNEREKAQILSRLRQGYAGGGLLR